ncbi:hypothetical protein HDU90_001391 [Geranomyces variabilis]|nr:hypothetical protein HDU90_001391 [Geranomyces variabilis]
MLTAQQQTSRPSSLPPFFASFELVDIKICVHARSTTVSGSLVIAPTAHVLVDRVSVTANLSHEAPVLRETLYVREGGQTMAPTKRVLPFEFVLNGVGTEATLPVRVVLQAVVERVGKTAEPLVLEKEVAIESVCER